MESVGDDISEFFLGLAHASEEEIKGCCTARCREAAAKGIKALSVLASGATEYPWLKISYDVGERWRDSEVLGGFLATGTGSSFVLVKILCYFDLYDAVSEAKSEKELRVIGETVKRKYGRRVKVACAFAVALLAQTPLALQVKHDSKSWVQAGVGGYGDIPITWNSVYLALSRISGLRCGGVVKELNGVKTQLLADLNSTIQWVNRKDTDVQKFLEQLRETEDFEELMEMVLTETDLSEHWLVSTGRYACHGVGALLLASQLGLMEELNRQGIEELGWGSGLAIGAGVVGLVSSFEILREYVGKVPGRLFDTAVSLWNGERPLFPEHNGLRYSILALGLVMSSLAWAPSADGSETITSGLSEGLSNAQISISSIGLGLMAWEGWAWLTDRVVRYTASKSDNEETQARVQAIGILESYQATIEEMTPQAFARFLLKLPNETLERLLKTEGEYDEESQLLSNPKISRVDLQELSGLYGPPLLSVQQMGFDSEE